MSSRTTSPVAARAPSLAERVRPGLLAEVERVREQVTAHEQGRAAAAVPRRRPRGGNDRSPLAHLVEALGLSPFERDLLLLATAVELDGEAAATVARLQGGDPRPTFGLALAALSDGHWDALAPGRPLRYWLLVDLAPGPTLATRPLVLDEDVLHHLTGLDQALPGDDRAGPLAALARRPDPVLLTPTQERLADDLAASVEGLGAPCLVRLHGDDAEAVLGVAHRLATGLGRRALVLRGEALPDHPAELSRLARLVDRDVLLRHRLPVVTAGPSVARLADALEAPVAVLADEGEGVPGRVLLRRDVGLPEPSEQRALWQGALAPDGDALAAEVGAVVEEIAAHYRLAARSIDAAAREWRLHAAARPGADCASVLRRLARERARVGLDGLAERIDSRAGWDDLVLPEGQLLLLQAIRWQVQHRTQVYERWGFADTVDRGLGVTALFAGESGTGKTLAAEVLASELGLDLYRIDLSAVVSKYIGETEKNLSRVFAAAEAGGAVLLFDEADALFGKRGEVRDSHDRYANLEVAYLLQRMESYRGLAILTTNLRSNVDRAFLRRIRFVVQFPFPDEAMRAQIWRRAFPARTPLDGVDADDLARLQVPGGSIRSIALGAAFAAAAAGTAVTPDHVLHAAHIEYAKAERRLDLPPGGTR
jgi:vesicle-fusing ATPase